MRLFVEGQNPLNGTYQPSGNANAALAAIAAALLTDQPMILRNVPQTATTRIMQNLAVQMGVNIAQDDPHTLRLQTGQLTRRVLDTQGSVGALLLLAPMLIQRQHVRLEVDFPLNRIRTHLEALRDLGIDVTTTNGAVECKVAAWEKREVLLSQASVTATGIVMMLAARLGRETVIDNAACEPHVQELAHLLNDMGARIEGVGSNRLKIFGVPQLGGSDIRIRPDHIEAASVAAIAAICGGRVTVDGIRLPDIQSSLKVLRRLGIQFDADNTTIHVAKHSGLTLSNRDEDLDASIETAPFPGFPSDLVAVTTVVATQTRGTSLIHEKLFDNRLLFVDKLKSMGAQIVLCDPHRAIVVGQTPLNATYIDTPDIRTGLAMLGAALAAHGRTVIDNSEIIERSFEGAIEKFKALGAKITLES